MQNAAGSHAAAHDGPVSRAAVYDWANLRPGCKPLPPRMPPGSTLPPFVSTRDSDGIPKPIGLHPPAATLNHSLSAHAYAFMDRAGVKMDPAGADYAKKFWETFMQLSWRQIEPVTSRPPPSRRPPPGFGQRDRPPHQPANYDPSDLPPRPPRGERLPPLSACTASVGGPEGRKFARVAHAYFALDQAGLHEQRRDFFMALAKGHDAGPVVARAKAPPNFNALTKRRDIDFNLLDSLSRLSTGSTSPSDKERFGDLIGLDFDEAGSERTSSTNEVVQQSFDESLDFSEMLNAEDDVSAIDTPAASGFEPSLPSRDAPSTEPLIDVEPVVVDQHRAVPVPEPVVDPPVIVARPKARTPVVRRPKVRARAIFDDDTVEF